MNIGKIFKQVQEVQARMGKAQEDIAMLEAMGSAGGGMVTLTLTGKHTLKGVSIDPSLLVVDEKEVLEDLMMAAHSEAKRKIDELVADRMKEATGGLQLPPGVSLPF